MTEMTKLNLEDVPAAGPVHFIAAEWRDDSPLVIVRYSVYGMEASLGIRLDLDKRVFLDDIPEKRWQVDVRNHTREVWTAIAIARGGDGETIGDVPFPRWKEADDGAPGPIPIEPEVEQRDQ